MTLHNWVIPVRVRGEVAELMPDLGHCKIKLNLYRAHLATKKEVHPWTLYELIHL